MQAQQNDQCKLKLCRFRPRQLSIINVQTWLKISCRRNNMMCFFCKLDRMVRSRLFSTYCGSRYVCELWSLDNSDIDVFSTAWRKTARRVLKLPPDTHNSLIPLLLNTLPFYNDICKQSARFIISCLQSNVSLVRFVARFGVFVNRCTLSLGRNI